MEKQILEGKKLLILAGGPDLVTLVKRAKELGVYTIVSDFYDTDTSPAKLIADEYWDISWSDLDALEYKCREVGVDGITTGYSETPVEKCIELCERLGFPCYCTRYQLDCTKNKRLFKETCRRNGVSTVKEYARKEDVDSYPVIVKPADRAGSIGVSIAENVEELEKAYAYGMEMSYCKEVIIEQYITGTKVDVYYQIRNGEVTLLSTDGVINAKDNGHERVVQSAWCLPAYCHSLIVEKADPALRRMIADLGIRDGYLSVSGFEDHGELMFFECGFRLCGGHLYNYLEKMGHINNLDIFIYHALTGRTLDIQENGDINQNMKCVNINLYAKAGTVGCISGMEEIAAMDDCAFTLITGHVGQICHQDKAILDKMGMYYFCSEDPEQLQKDAEKAYSLIRVQDVDGNDMLYDRIDTNVISYWWNR